MRISKLLLIALLSVYAAMTATADSFTQDGLTFCVTSDSVNTVEITARADAMSETWKNLEIPATVWYDEKEYQVTSIADGVFYLTLQLQTLKVPASVTHIGARAWAFARCRNLEKVSLPSLVEERY